MAQPPCPSFNPFCLCTSRVDAPGRFRADEGQGTAIPRKVRVRMVETAVERSATPAPTPAPTISPLRAAVQMPAFPKLGMHRIFSFCWLLSESAVVASVFLDFSILWFFACMTNYAAKPSCLLPPKPDGSRSSPSPLCASVHRILVIVAVVIIMFRLVSQRRTLHLCDDKRCYIQGLALPATFWASAATTKRPLAVQRRLLLLLLCLVPF